MNGIIKFIETYQSQIKIVITAALILAALIFGGINLFKSVAAFSKGNTGDGVKNLIFAVIIILIAAVGIGGMIMLVNVLSEGAGVGLFDTKKINIR